MIRAVLEGVAYGLRDSFEIIAAMGVEIAEVRASGGGARSELWRQIQTDVTGYPHCTVNVDEGPAYGAALLAAVAAGTFGSVEEACAATIRVVDAPAVNADDHALYTKWHGLYQQLYPRLKGQFADAAELVEESSG